MNSTEKEMSMSIYRDFKQSEHFVDAILGLKFERAFEIFLIDNGLDDLFFTLTDVFKPIFENEINSRKSKVKKLNFLLICDKNCDKCDDVKKQVSFCPFNNGIEEIEDEADTE